MNSLLVSLNSIVQNRINVKQMKVAIFAEMTSAQLNYLRSLAQDNNIEARIIVEGESQPQPTPTATPITGEMLSAVAQATDRSALEIAVQASNLGINTVEEALAHTSVSSEIKRILEEYI
jgi:hypothetical protein